MTDFKEIAQKYKLAGLECLPCKPDKAPLLPKSWKEEFLPDEFINATAIGIKCGQYSGGLECLDFDNHFDDAKQNLKNYLVIPEVDELYKKYKFPIESTMNGGFHLLFRCVKNEGNRKLAQRLNKDNRPEAIIETRGEGGYFVAYPSDKYLLICNDITKIATIQAFERAILIDNAVALNEYYTQIKTNYEGSDRPGDVFNQEISEGEVKSILINSGWKELRNKKWCRPGKKEGISASMDYINGQLFFYCFTANGSPFEQQRAYTPFQILGLLKFNGDFSAAAKSITPEKQITKGITTPDIETLLFKSKIDTTIKVERPPTILSRKEYISGLPLTKRLFTLGNFSCIIGKAKVKKTFFISLVVSALLKNKSELHFESRLPDGKETVIYFDTEQGEYDSYNVIKRIERMSLPGENFKGFSLRPYTPQERCAIIEHAFKLWGDNTCLCVIDGVADLANAINDEEEATRVTTMLLRLSKVYNCHITTVIHQNKNDNFATGHLGSSIMKKAELLISVTKNKNNKAISDICCDLSRGVDFEPFAMSVNSDGLPEICDTEEPIKTKSFYDTDEKEEESPF